MKATSVSTSALTNATREARLGLQTKLTISQKEATTGRLADVGETLGFITDRTISLRQDVDRLETFKDTNVVANTRLEMTQQTLDNVTKSAQSFLTTLMAARSTRSSSSVAITDSKEKLLSLVADLNTAQNGAYIFSGINTDVKPVTPYFGTPPSAGQTAVAGAFNTEFGFPQNDPGASAITGAQMKTFLDGSYDTLFNGANWSSTWSSASDQNITTRISTNERVETSTNANKDAFRKLASAYTMIADLGIEKLNDAAYQEVIDKAIKVVGQAIGDVTQIRAALGTSQERIANANSRADAQLKVMKEHITSLEAVDPYEAMSNVNALMTQIETAYSLTARLQNLSLVKYI